MDHISSLFTKPMPVSRISTRKPIIVGHRGALDLAPENTMPAFEAALHAGADGVEFDVQRTIDGHLVVFHDEDVSRVTDGTGKLPRMTLQEARSLDAGVKFDARFKGTRVPTLAEFFDWVRGNDLLLFLELKEPFLFPGIEQEVADMIREYGLVDRVQVRSFYHANLLKFHTVAPEIAISELWLNHLPWFGEIVYSTLNVMGSLCTEAFIADTHALGRKVTAWVVDDLELARNLKAWGIDGLTTNNPEKLLTIFDSE